MNAAIVHTDVVSMLFKGDSQASGFLDHFAGRLLGISFMTVAEVERWPMERHWGLARRADFARHLARYVVLPVSRELCVQWAKVTFSVRRLGRPIQTSDAWIAASAIYYEVPLITNNAADYAMIDSLSVLSA
jgi:predicted nucleic acid-binding protein